MSSWSTICNSSTQAGSCESAPRAAADISVMGKIYSISFLLPSPSVAAAMVPFSLILGLSLNSHTLLFLAVENIFFPWSAGETVILHQPFNPPSPVTMSQGPAVPGGCLWAAAGGPGSQSFCRCWKLSQDHGDSLCNRTERFLHRKMNQARRQLGQPNYVVFA